MIVIAGGLKSLAKIAKPPLYVRIFFYKTRYFFRVKLCQLRYRRRIFLLLFNYALAQFFNVLRVYLQFRNEKLQTSQKSGNLRSNFLDGHARVSNDLAHTAIKSDNPSEFQAGIGVIGNRTQHRQTDTALNNLLRTLGAARSAFAILHNKWLTAEKRQDMNLAMDALAGVLGIHQFTGETLSPVEVDVDVEGAILHTTVPYYFANVGRIIEWPVTRDNGDMDVIGAPVVKVYPPTDARQVQPNNQ